MTRTPTEAERDAPVKLDGDYTLDEVAQVMMAVRPEDLPSDERDGTK